GRWHQREEENDAVRVLKDWSDNRRIALVVSAVHDRERPLPEQYRSAHAAMSAALPRVEFADDHQLRGFNTVYARSWRKRRVRHLPADRGRIGRAPASGGRPRPGPRGPRPARVQAAGPRARNLP